MKFFLYWLLLLNLIPAVLSSAEKMETIETAIAPTYSEGRPDAAGTVTRKSLNTNELVANQPVNFVLRLRNFTELKQRIERGEVLTVEEMTRRYFPTAEDWHRVAGWARAQGLTVAPEDMTRMTVAASSSVKQVQQVLQMRFARVMGTNAKEYTSGISAPSIPADLNDSVLTVSGLQPHLQPRLPQALDIRQIDGRYILPQTFAQLYNSTGLGLDGAGQRIAIIGANKVNPDDLTAFWQTCGLPTTIAQYKEVNLSNNPVPGSYDRSFEETMDVEWASAMAPGADIVLITSLSMNEVTPWIVSEFAAGRPIHQISTSYGLPESVLGEGGQGASTQYYATLAALGVSIFVASGDDGSTQTIVNSTQTFRGYDPDGVTSPLYPASDPYVTGVGGTSVAFQYDGQGLAINPVMEGAWTLPHLPGPPLLRARASGGGISWYFARPAWQTGPNIPDGTKRCVPDVAALASCNYSPYVQFRGTKWVGNGTSLSAPIWAGLCALINQARAEKGLSALGLLGPRIYPLIGTEAFNQMTTGSQSGGDGFISTATNGAYIVGPHYNLVTGLGSPNIEYLVAALTLEEPAPATPVTPAPPTQQPATPAPPPPAGGSSGGGGGGGGSPSFWFLAGLTAIGVVRHWRMLRFRWSVSLK